MGRAGRPGKLIGLGLLAWYSVTGWPDAGWPAEGPYLADSPTLREQVLYDDEGLAAEAERILDEERAEGRDGIEGLAQLAPLFCRPERLVGARARELAETLQACRALNVPPAPSLAETDAELVEAVQIVDRISAAAQRWARENREA